MVRTSQRDLRAHADAHARAGLIASECSLIGLGAATLLVTLLLLMLPDFGGLQLLRPGLATSAGLLACGAAISVVGRWLDLGGSRRQLRLARLWWPLLVCALMGAGGGWLALHRAGQVRETADRVLWPTPLLGLFAFLAVLAVVTLAALGLRALVSVAGAARLPVVQLWQATTHALLGGLGLITFIGVFSETLPRGLQVYLATAMCVTAGHAALAATALLHDSRRTLRGLRAAGLHVQLLERGHALASSALPFEAAFLLAEVGAANTQKSVGCALAPTIGFAPPEERPSATYPSALPRSVATRAKRRPPAASTVHSSVVFVAQSRTRHRA